MATKLTPTRHDFYQEEVDYRSALSEALFTKMGQNQQFITEKQLLHHELKFLGAYHPISGGEDGVLLPIFNYEVVGLSFRNRISGDLNETEIDIHKINSNGTDAGSILSSTAKINHADTDQFGHFTNLLDGTSNIGPSSQLPVFTSTTFSAGEALRIDIVANADNSEDLVVCIWYRPT